MKVHAMQLDYDHRQAMKKVESRMSMNIWWLVFVILAIVSFTVYMVFRNRKTTSDSSRYKSRLSSLEREQSDLNAQLSMLRETLDSNDSRHSREIARLNRKLEAKVSEQKRILACGKTLFDLISSGGSIVKWTTDDFDCFFEYYDIVNPEFLEKEVGKYANLSYGNRLLLILEKMGLDSASICTAMGISPGSLRSARSRLKAKRLP